VGVSRIAFRDISISSVTTSVISREEGGEAVSFGSDAHEPEHVARGFADAAAIAESCGFRPAADPLALWTRL
jgi:hypothetical protein